MTKLGRSAVHKFVGAMETVGLAPGGTQKTADHLAVAADSLVEGAKVNNTSIGLKVSSAGS